MKKELLIDKRNEAIWREINDYFVTEIQVHQGHHYYNYLKENKAIFYIPMIETSIELFTYELLRMHLRVKQIFITEYLFRQLKHEPLLFWSCNEGLFEQVGRYLENTKILPLYLQMRFERDKFSENYHQPCCSFMNIQIIYSGMKKAIPSLASIDMFINKFFAMKADPNPEHDYTGRFEDLKNINSELYRILDKFWENWVGFDITRYDPAKYSYKGFTADFFHELGLWAVSTVYVKINTA